MDIPRATEKPPIAESGSAVRVRMPDRSSERMGTTVMFAAVGSSSDMACLARGFEGVSGLLAWLPPFECLRMAFELGACD